jgi:hypothetical protein
MRNRGLVLYLLICLLFPIGSTPVRASTERPDSSYPPLAPVKLIFVHHATGGNWLADPKEGKPYGGLGRALMENNYYVSATNRGWGPNGIGDRTDIADWPRWFLGPERELVLDELYSENGQNVNGFGDWSRLGRDPGGENQIVLLKSRPSNSNLEGSPDDPPLSVPRHWEMSVANAKAVYLALLNYFRYRPDKLFVVITSPPLPDDETTPENAANARALNNWLVHEWLQDYPYGNVVVFDYYNVLTGVDNHHRWAGGVIEHVQHAPGNVVAYPAEDSQDARRENSYPSSEGQAKATAEFVPLLNVYYNRWQMAKAAALAAEKSPPGDVDSSTPIEGVVDDFESALAWHVDVGEGALVECDFGTGAGTGTRALRLVYAIPREGRGGCWRRFEPPADWSSYRGLSFRVRGDPPLQVVVLTLFAGSLAEPVPYEAHFEVTPDWALIAFGWSDFERAASASGEGTPSLDPSSIARMGFSPEVGEGNLDIAELTLFDGLVLSTSSEATVQVPDVITTTIEMASEPLPLQEPINTTPPEVRDVVPRQGPLMRILCALAPVGLLALILGLVLLRRNAGPRKPLPKRDSKRKEP